MYAQRVEKKKKPGSALVFLGGGGKLSFFFQCDLHNNKIIYIYIHPLACVYACVDKDRTIYLQHPRSLALIFLPTVVVVTISELSKFMYTYPSPTNFLSFLFLALFLQFSHHHARTSNSCTLYKLLFFITLLLREVVTMIITFAQWKI